MPSKLIKNISPHEKLFDRKPDYSSLRIFGCLCFPYTRPYNKHKLQFRSDKATFLGYSSSHKGYKALLPNGKLIITRDIVFDESVFPFQSLSSSSSNKSESASTSSSYQNMDFFLVNSDSGPPLISMTNPPVQPSSSDTSSPSSHYTPPVDSSSAAQSESEPPTDPPPRSDPVTSSIKQLQATHSMTTRSKAGIYKPKVFSLTVSSHSLPKSALEALLIPSWKSAMLSEFKALVQNKTWILTTLPPGKNLIGCTWIFKLKLHLSGEIARHKARLVAQGFSQMPGFDFTDTFSPVVKPTTIRLILSLAVSMGWNVTHLDVNNAFLNGQLKEDIYMKQPLGFEQGGPHLVCKLNKAIYGLKQASRAWFYTVHSVLIGLGFSQSKADASMFFRHLKNEVIYLLIYVDDMLITGSSMTSIQFVISQLNSHFSLKDLGEVSLFLGVEVVKTANDGLHLCQSSYIKDLLKKANMTGAKGAPTPMVSSIELSKHVGEPVTDAKFYRSIVGALQYAAITRPDINFAVNKVSQYMAQPLDNHWKAVKRILRYLSGTLDYGIQIHKTDGSISAFSDSDWATDLDDRRSVTGICAYHGRNLVSWHVKKQAVVARSSTEAEYRSLAQAAAEVAWLISLLGELKVEQKERPVIWVDNMSAIALASNPVLHARTKHIELDMHFVRDKVLAREVELRHVPSVDQVADILTKPLSHQSFVKLRERLGVVSLASLGLRGRVGVPCKQDESPCKVKLCEIEDGVADVSGISTQDKMVNESSRARLVTMQMATANKQDHLCPWKNVLLNGVKKKAY